MRFPRGITTLVAIWLALGCASEERFLRRSVGILAARDQAEEVAAAIRAMDPSRLKDRPDGGTGTPGLREILHLRLEGLSAVAACRTRIAHAAFFSGGLEVAVSTEVDGTGSGGGRVSRRWLDRVRYRFDEETGEIQRTDWSLGSRQEVSSAAILFRDRTEEVGLTSTVRRPRRQLRNRLVDGVWSGCGATAIDYDRDGWTDIFAGDGVRSILYRNCLGKRFEDRTAEAGLPDALATGTLAFDYDGDGWTDLLLVSHFGPERLFRNLQGRFQEVTAAAGVGKAEKGTSATAADIDGDGDIDLYVLQSGDYFRDMPMPAGHSLNGYPNILYRNEGGGTFTEITETAGAGSTGWSLAAAFADLDDDGDPDLYVANDFGLNNYYENQGDGTFRDATARAGLGDRGYGMGVSVGDYDGDGLLDLYVANIETPYGYIYADPDLPLPLMGQILRPWVVPWFVQMTSGSTLFRNLGEGRFQEEKGAGAREGGWAWGASFLDFDSDGDLDIYSPNGFAPGEGTDSELEFWIESVLYWEEYVAGEMRFERKGRPLQGYEVNRLFRQDRKGRFTEIAYPAGVADSTCARGMVLADFDNDGDLDIYLRNYEGPSLYLTYEGERGHWLQVSLVGDGGNTAGVGARVTLEAGGLRQVREVSVGQAYLGGHSPILHFGLGEAEKVDRLRVRWPDGTLQEQGDLPIDSRIEVEHPRLKARALKAD